MDSATAPSAEATPCTFYDPLAADYDQATGGAARAAAAARFIAALAQRCAFRSALDVACGTGVYALALAQAGHPTVGSDLSGAMLEQARRRAALTGLTVDWVEAPMQRLATALPRTFDLVLCMGNSLPHLLTDGDLAAALAGFRLLLNPGGHLVLHLLNYERILAHRERLVAIDRTPERAYVRFYDFLGERLRFNLLTIDWAGSAGHGTLRSVDLYPWRAVQLETALAAHGLTVAGRWGSLGFAEFAPDAADTLLLLARRP